MGKSGLERCNHVLVVGNHVLEVGNSEFFTGTNMPLTHVITSRIVLLLSLTIKTLVQTPYVCSYTEYSPRFAT